MANFCLKAGDIAETAAWRPLLTAAAALSDNRARGHRRPPWSGCCCACSRCKLVARTWIESCPPNPRVLPCTSLLVRSSGKRRGRRQLSGAWRANPLRWALCAGIPCTKEHLGKSVLASNTATTKRTKSNCDGGWPRPTTHICAQSFKATGGDGLTQATPEVPIVLGRSRAVLKSHVH